MPIWTDSKNEDATIKQALSRNLAKVWWFNKKGKYKVGKVDNMIDKEMNGKKSAKCYYTRDETNEPKMTVWRKREWREKSIECILCLDFQFPIVSMLKVLTLVRFWVILCTEICLESIEKLIQHSFNPIF